MTSENLKPWGEEEKAAWLARQTVKRSYADLAAGRIKALEGAFELHQYGALSIDPERYPLFAVKSKAWDAGKPTALITGGVHGYETSGVLGTLKFLEEQAAAYEKNFNIVSLPCISPWAFETINRWNPRTENPNREFKRGTPCEESSFAMAFIDGLGAPVDFHMDCHETTDTDSTEFLPLEAAKIGEPYVEHGIPDGYYLVAPADHPNPGLERAVIDSVRAVTHIAPPDENGQLVGVSVRHEGVVDYREDMGLCMNYTDAAAKFGALTTEVYPDSPRVTDDICNDAQVAAITGALAYIKSES